MTADEIYSQAFSKPRTPRSAEYREGVLAALQYRIEHRPIEQQFPVGTVAADAYFAGVDEGHRLWRASRAT